MPSIRKDARYVYPPKTGPKYRTSSLKYEESHIQDTFQNV